MGNNDGRKEFEIIISSLLNQAKSKKQINKDIKSLENVVNALRLTATFAKGATKKELNAYIRQLGDQLSTIKLKAKFDERALKREINQALNNVSYKEIDLLNINENKFKLKAKKALADTKTFVSKNPIYVNVELKKEKLNNQLTTYLTKNSKIRESEVLLKEADMLRDKISAINDKNSLKNATESFQLFKSEVQAVGYQTKSTTDKVKNMVSGITKIGSMFGVASIAVNNFVKSLQTLKSNDTILTEISKTSEMTKQQLVELGNESFKTASKFGQLSSNYLVAVQEMARSGYEDTSKELGKLSLLAQSAGDMTAENANDFLLATDAAYEYSGSVDKLNAALDGANYISNKNSASLTDLADAIRVSASYASNAGVSIDQLTAAEGTMIAVTKRSGSEMGRAFRSILLNLQQVSGEFDGEVIDEEQLKKVESRCHSLGVELEYLKDGVATLRNPIEILKELADVYNSLPDNSADKQGLISDLGGKYHANALSALLSRWDLYEKMLVDYSKGAGSALEEANKTADSWEGRLNSLRNSWDSFVNSLTNKNAIKGGISFFDKSIQSAETLVDTLGEIPVLLTTINTAMVALNKDYGITQVINPETNKFDIQGNMFGIDFSAVKAQKKHFEEASKAISTWNKELNVGKIDIEGFNIEVVKNNKQLKSYLSTCSKDAPASLSGYKAYLNAAGVSTDALRIKTVLLNSALTLGASIAIQFAVTAISKLVNAEKEAVQSAQEATKVYSESSSGIQDYVTKYKELHDALVAAKGDESETYNIKQQLLELQTELNEKYGEEFGKLNLVTNAYKDQTKAIEAYNKEAAKRYLNENKKGIDKATSEMTKDRGYILGGTAELSNPDAQKVRKQILDLTKEFDDITLSQSGIMFTGTALEADKVINEFMTKVRELKEEYKDSEQVIQDVFDGVLNSSSNALSKAGSVIEKYQDIYETSQMAQIASNDSLSKGYNEVVSAVETYNEAVLKSENPYDDKNVKSAWDNLQKVKQGIQANKEEWGQYSNVMNKVFDSANDDVYSFYQTMKNDDISKFTEELKGLSDTDLQAMFDDGNNGDAFDKLCEKAKAYGLEVQDIIDLLIQLGVAQGEIASGVDGSDGGNFIKSFSEAWNDEDFSKAKDELLTLAEAGRLTPETLQSTEEYKKLLEQTSMSAEETAKKINLMTDASTQLQSMSSQISKMSDMLADKKNGTTASADDLASFDVEVRGLESWKEFENVMMSSNSTMEQCQQAANDLATEWVNNSNFLANLTEETKQSYITQLEKMGVENAEQVVLTALGASTEYATLAIAHNSDEKNRNIQVSTDLSNATADEIIQLINEGNASDETANSLYHYALEKSNASNLTLATAADCSNLYNLVSALGVASSALKNYAYAKRVLESAQKWDDSPLKDAAIANAENTLKSLEASATKDIKTVFDKTNNVKISPKGSSGHKSTSTGKSKSGSGSSKSDTKQTVDWIERKISSLNNNIDLTESKLNNLFNIKTPKGLSKQITDVSNKLKKASVNTDKWKSKLSKIKIPDSAKKLIQDGKDVNLSKYSKTEQKNIKKYQSTWKSYSSAKKKENSLYNRKWDLETQKGKEALLKSQEKDYNTLAKIEEKAYKKYMSKAKSVKLSSSLKKKVQSGDYKISDYSSKTQSLIQEYQDWWDKAQDANKGKYEAKKNARDKRIERYQLYVDDAEAKIAKSQALTELKSGNYKEQNKQLEKQKKYLKESYDWQIKIAKENGKILEADKLRSEYQKELNDLTMQEFDNIANTYDNKVGLNNNKIKAFQDQISLLEAKGQKIGSALYTKQMSLNNINEKKLIAEREKLIEKLNKIPKGTDDWYKAQDTLFSVESDLVNVQIENANLQKSINQLKFDRFDDLLNKLNDIVDETDFLIDMLDSENFYDDNGKITDDGITAMGLTAQNYDTYLAEAEQYKQMLSDVKDMYDAGKISLEEYEEYQRTYAQGQRDAIKNANECKKAVIDYVKQGLDAQNEALEREIENRKKLLAEQKESRDFNKKLLDLNKEIARTERQLEVLNSGADDSEENRKKVRELKSKLEDLKSDRDDTLYDKSIEDQQNALDKMLTDAQDASSQYLKNSEVVFVDALNKVNANTEIVSNNLEKISSDLGYDISTNITDAWKDGGKAVDTYESILQGNIPKITTQIGLITSAWNEACEAAEKAAQAMVDTTTDNYLEHATIGANGNNNGNGSSSETKTSLSDIKNFITKNAKEAKNDKSYYAPLNQYIYDKTKGKVLSKENERKLAKLLNVDIKTDLTGDKGREELAKIRDALKLAGFSKGGVISELSDAIRLNGDTVLVSAKPGERMLTEQQNGYWEKWTQSLPNLMNLTDIIKPNVNIPTAIPTVNREQSPVYNIDSSITVDGVATNEIVKDMANVAKKQAENVISEINRRTYAKGVRWK